MIESASSSGAVRTCCAGLGVRVLPRGLVKAGKRRQKPEQVAATTKRRITGNSIGREAAALGVSGCTGTQQQVFRSAEKFATVQRHPLQLKYRRNYGGVIDAAGAQLAPRITTHLASCWRHPQRSFLEKVLMHKLISLLALSSLPLPVLADPILVVPEPESLSLLAVAAVAMLATVVRRGRK